jgi:hypothetical protein
LLWTGAPRYSVRFLGGDADNLLVFRKPPSCRGRKHRGWTEFGMSQQQPANLTPETVDELVFGRRRKPDDSVMVTLAPGDRDVGGAPGLTRLLTRDAAGDGVGPG